MKEFFKRLTLEKILVRIIIAWLIVNIIGLVKINANFTSPEFMQNVNIPMYLCFIVILFVSFCALGRFKMFSWVEIYSPMMLITIYGFLAVREYGDPGFIMGIALFLAVSIIYAVSKSQKFLDVTNRSTVIITCLVAGVFFVFITGTIAIMGYASYSSDFMGIYEILKIYEGRFSDLGYAPILFVMWPFYMLISRPAIVILLQVIVVISGIAPIILICLKKKLSKSAILMFGVLFALFPSLICCTGNDISENCFYVPFLLWLLYFVEKNDMKFGIIFTVLTLLVNEYAPIYIICIGAFILFDKRKYVFGGIVTALGVLAYVGIRFIVGHGTLHITNGEFAVNAAFVLSECFTTGKLTYMLYLIAPTGLLSLGAKKVSGLLVIFPVLVINFALLPAENASVYSEFSFGAAALLIYLGIVNYSQLGVKMRRSMASFAVCFSIVLMPVTSLANLTYFDNYYDHKAEISELNKMIDTIPDDCTVSASDAFLVHLYNKDKVYRVSENIHTDYYILDIRNDDIKESDIVAIVKSGYKIILRERNFFILLEKRSLVNSDSSSHS